ncbi:MULTISPECIES: hypothetical protein [Flavobacteriaceae]|uniref:hypothetical protein n=1 Tax=Flavobacteriaceae TaxID=49546 RepID=UPI001491E3B5|nr:MULTISPECIES: hypothetical protein [Allomuricauda]MDC6366681.1 hypothetical protein [Muricauda sp. AC10]
MKQLFMTVLLLVTVSISMKSQTDYSPGFEAGKPEEMNKLAFLKGKWNINLKWTNDVTQPKDKWLSAGMSKSEFLDYYEGTFLQEKSLGFPLGKTGHEGFTNWEYNSVFSYDRFQKKYRCIAFDNIMGLTDIYEGNFNGENLVLTNAKTSTYNNQGTNGGNQKNRMTLIPISDNRFEVIWENIDEIQLNPNDIHSSEWNFVILMIYKKIE